MVEKTPVVEDEVIEYEGYFNLKELYGLINDVIIAKGYAPVEAKCQEVVAKKGKFIHCEMFPYKKFSDYVKSEIKIKLSITDAKDIVVKKAGKSKKLKQGHVHVTLNGYLLSDYAAKWEYKWWYVFRVMFEKYIYAPIISNYAKTNRADVDHFKEQIKAFLNIQQM